MIDNTNLRSDSNPCRGCEQREIGCHASCEKYNEWKDSHIKAKRAYNDVTYKERRLDIDNLERFNRCRKLRGRKRKPK